MDELLEYYKIASITAPAFASTKPIYTPTISVARNTYNKLILSYNDKFGIYVDKRRIGGGSDVPPKIIFI